VEFFKRVQNKIHYAIHGQTAAEVIVNRADAEKEFMGLTTFEGDRPHLKDAVIAKNYLDEKELRAMGQIVSGYLDFAERQAERQQTMTMKDWATHLDSILTMSGEKLLQDTGKVSHQEAIEHATNEYKKYQQRTLSHVEKDFLDNIKSLPKKIILFHYLRHSIITGPCSVLLAILTVRPSSAKMIFWKTLMWELSAPSTVSYHRYFKERAQR